MQLSRLGSALAAGGQHAPATPQPIRQPEGPCAGHYQRREDRFTPAEAQDSGDWTQGLNKKVSSLIGAVMGLKAEDITLSFDSLNMSQERGYTAREQVAGDDQGNLDYASSYHAYEATKLNAEGCFTTADGRSFTFTLDLSQERSVSEEHTFAQRSADPDDVRGDPMAGFKDILRFLDPRQDTPTEPQPADSMVDRLRQMLEAFREPVHAAPGQQFSAGA